MAKRKRSSSGFLTGLVIGIAIGAAITLILTPRPDMASTSDPTDAGAGEPQPASADPLGAAVARVRDRYQDALVQGRETFERVRSEVMQVYNQARSQP